MNSIVQPLPRKAASSLSAGLERIALILGYAILIVSAMLLAIPVLLLFVTNVPIVAALILIGAAVSSFVSCLSRYGSDGQYHRK